MNIYAPPRPRALVHIDGPEAQTFLQGLITNDMARLAHTTAIYAALLSPQGKIAHTFFVINAPQGGYFLDVLADGAADLLRRLRMFRLRAAVTLESVDDTAMVALADTGANLPKGAFSFTDPRNEALGLRLIMPPKTLAQNDKVYEARRIGAGIPDQGADFGVEEVFPSDVNMDVQNGVAFKKGCYIGQEVVSRMKRRGTIRKRIMRARFKGAAPDFGTPIMAGPARLGDVRSSCGKAALALIRTDRLEVAKEACMAGGQHVVLTMCEEAKQ